MLGEDHPDTATSYNNLAYVYVRQEKYGKAEELCEKAFVISKRMLGEDHSDTKVIYENMRSVYYEWNPEGDFEKWLKGKVK